MPLPKALTVYLTTECGLRCSHCFLVNNGSIGRYQLNQTQIRRILDDASTNKVFLISLAGGDPLLHPQFFDVIQEIHRRKMSSLLALTGLDITAEQARRLSQSGVASIQLSLDGHDEETNSYYRGPGAFTKIVKSFDQLKEFGLKVNLAFCLDQNNFLKINDMMKFALQKDAYKVKVQYWQPDESGESRHRALTAEQRAWVKQQLANLDVSRRNWIIDCEMEEINQPNSIVIGADGWIRRSELGQRLGHVDIVLPSEVA